MNPNTMKDSNKKYDDNLYLGGSIPYLVTELGRLPKSDKETEKKVIRERKFEVKKNITDEYTLFQINLERATFEDAKEFVEFTDSSLILCNKNIILDFSRCIFMDSTFFGAIIRLSKKIISRGDSIILVIDPNKVKLFHTLEELRKMFNVYTSIESAIANL